MEYKTIYEGERPVSRLIYGTGNNQIMGDDVGAAKDCLQRALESGFTTFDTAYSYGNAEINVGQWLMGLKSREEITIIDKGCNPGQKGSTECMSAELIERQNKESLNRLQTDYVEFYVLHRDDPNYPVEPVIEVLNKLKEEGKILHFGASNWSLDRIRQANAYAKDHGLEGFETLSPAYSLATFVSDPWGGSVTISGEKNKELRETYLNSGLPIFAYSSLARGYLSGKFSTRGEKPIEKCLWWAPIQEYDCPENRERLERLENMAEEKGLSVPRLALAWLINQSPNIYPIVSPSSLGHMEENIKALEIQLSEKEINYLLKG